jgi:hypothetical protein
MLSGISCERAAAGLLIAHAPTEVDGLQSRAVLFAQLAQLREHLVVRNAAYSLLAHGSVACAVVPSSAGNHAVELVAVRNSENKLHPDLVGRNKLLDSVKRSGRSVVHNWPRLLAEAVLAVQRQE